MGRSLGYKNTTQNGFSKTTIVTKMNIFCRSGFGAGSASDDKLGHDFDHRRDSG